MTELVKSKMIPKEARECVDKINANLTNIRALVLDLYEREGWRTLGYKSWRDCVTAEFRQNERYLYRQLEAAQIAKQIWPKGQKEEIPERQLRPLSKLKDNPEQQREAWQQAVATAPDGKITASLVNEIVKGMTEGVEKLRPAPRQKITLYAIEFAGTVINQLEMIAANDPKREEGLRIVERWIQKNTAGREPKKLRRLGKGRITRYKLVGDSLINQTCLELIASRE